MNENSSTNIEDFPAGIRTLLGERVEVAGRMTGVLSSAVGEDGVEDVYIVEDGSGVEIAVYADDDIKVLPPMSAPVIIREPQDVYPFLGKRVKVVSDSGMAYTGRVILDAAAREVHGFALELDAPSKHFEAGYAAGFLYGDRVEVLSE